MSRCSGVQSYDRRTERDLGSPSHVRVDRLDENHDGRNLLHRPQCRDRDRESPSIHFIAPFWKLRSRFWHLIYFTSSLVLGLRPTSKVLISTTLVFFSHIRNHSPPLRPLLPTPSLLHPSPPPKRKRWGSLFVFLQSGGCFLPQTVGGLKETEFVTALCSSLAGSYRHVLPFIYHQFLLPC